MNEPARNRKAFTLIELLAVILVISILVAVVVGVATQVIRKSAEDSTKLYMQIIIKAVSVYHEEYGAYPDLDPAGDDTARGAELYAKLWVTPRCRERLSPLPPEAMLAPGGNRYFVDGYQNTLRYHSRGLGGAPYLESCGGDGNFGSDAEPEAKEDNIRSDRL